jgi:plastocyanin
MTTKEICQMATVAVALLCLETTSALGHPASGRPGQVRGRVVVDVGAVRLAGLGALVVFLEGIDGALEYEIPEATAVIHQKGARFSPPFLAIAAGQTVDMPNDDAIFHNVFSYSIPNDFDLGMYEKGVSRSVTLRHPGVVRIYCSMHESMNGIVFVAPSPYFDVVDESGSFEIRDVPAGRYRLRTWNERLPEAVRVVQVGAAAPAFVEIRISEQGSSG